MDEAAKMDDIAEEEENERLKEDIWLLKILSMSVVERAPPMLLQRAMRETMEEMDLGW